MLVCFKKIKQNSFETLQNKNKMKPNQKKKRTTPKQNLTNTHNIQLSQTSLHLVLRSHIMCLQKLCSDSSNEITLSELGDHKDYVQNLVLCI